MSKECMPAEYKVKVKVPDLGLTPDQLVLLRVQLQDIIVGDMGGPRVLASKGIAVKVVILSEI